MPESYQKRILKTTTGLEETNDLWALLLAPDRDLFAIKKKGGAGKTEVHVLSAGSKYQDFSLHTATGLVETDNTWDFTLAPNKDLFAIRKKGGAGKTEVHIFSAGSKYKNRILNTSCLHETDDTWAFAIASNRDLFAIKKKGGAGKTEVHILSAGNNYQQFSKQTATCLAATDDNWAFAVASNRDLFAIKKKGGAGKTEVHILSAESDYQDYVLNTSTCLQETDNTWAFAVAANRDLFAINKMGGDHKTEVNIIYSGIFSPESHGFHFRNSFVVTPNELGLPDLGNFQWKMGFCGGMCASVINRFNALEQIPLDDQTPTRNSGLYSELFGRQKKSLSPGIIKRILEWQISPDLPDTMKPHSLAFRTKQVWPELQKRLVAKKLTTLVIIRREGVTENPTKNHQVVAYQCNYDQNTDTVKIDIYDPNHPDSMNYITLKLKAKGIEAKQSTNERVRGFFINPNGDSASK